MGQTRYSSYYEWISMDERTALESEIIRKCLSRSETQCSFLEYRGHKVIYRRYASLFFIVGTKTDKKGTENTENELEMLEFIHTLVECMVRRVDASTHVYCTIACSFANFCFGSLFAWFLFGMSGCRTNGREVFANSILCTNSKKCTF